jgi:hypothetical protein
MCLRVIKLQNGDNLLIAKIPELNLEHSPQVFGFTICSTGLHLEAIFGTNQFSTF